MNNLRGNQLVGTIKHPANKPVSELGRELTEDFVYEWTHNGTRYRLTVFKGFQYDGASVPQAFWAIGIWPDGLNRAGATAHDLLYKSKGDPNNHPHGRFEKLNSDGNGTIIKDHWTRSQADHLFGRILRESGYKKWKRRCAFCAVWWFGWRGWGK